MASPYVIDDWKSLNIFSLQSLKKKVLMKHPYCIGDEEKINKLVEVEVEGEFKDGIPHGLCQMFYIYSNEYNDIVQTNPDRKYDNPYLDD